MAESTIRRLLALAFWAPLVIASVSALLPKGPPLPFQINDIVLHAFAFIYLTAALGLAYYPPKRWLMPVCWMVLYGLALEVVQSFVPERTAESKDLIVDAIGIAIGMALWRYVLLPVTRRIASWPAIRE